MDDVERAVREYQEITYEVGHDTIQRAVMAHLYDHHNAAFGGDTSFQFHDEGLTISTRYECEPKEIEEAA